MSAPENLNDLYIDELKDLWSANDQMTKCLKKIAPKASDATLKEMLTKSLDGIAGHTDLLKTLIADAGEKVSKEHCKGMEGLCAEASKHVLEEGPQKGPVLDALIITQYQRMTHYGIAGFGTVASFAKTLGEDDACALLQKATAEIYNNDEYMTKLAETTVNIDADDDKDDSDLDDADEPTEAASSKSGKAAKAAPRADADKAGADTGTKVSAKTGAKPSAPSATKKNAA